MWGGSFLVFKTPRNPLFKPNSLRKIIQKLTGKPLQMGAKKCKMWLKVVHSGILVVKSGKFRR